MYRPRRLGVDLWLTIVGLVAHIANAVLPDGHAYRLQGTLPFNNVEAKDEKIYSVCARRSSG